MFQRIRRWLLIVAIMAGVGWAGLWFSPKPGLLDGVAFSTVFQDRNGGLLRLGLSSDDAYRIRTPLAEISPCLVEAALLHEDRYFYRHWGVNPVALAKASGNELIGARRRFGASTITMQLARIRFRLNTRTPWGKAWQIVKALQIECHYSKSEILESYFNLIPYGANIEGAGAAAEIYFHKRAKDLTLAEALTLDVIPQSPARRASFIARTGTELPPPLRAARMGLFQEWTQRHPADERQRATLEMPVRLFGIRDLPFRAPHLVEQITESARGISGATSIDLRAQDLVERQIHEYIEKRRRDGLENAAALLVDFRTMEVMALAGSANYFEPEICGQINGAAMRRSPGSALKPFVYALAMDEGIIHPHSLLKDAPICFNGYSPENFDGAFRGPIQACDALIQSRNVPAVYLASQLRKRSFYAFLREAGIGDLKEESHYGLTTALGGTEVTMEELGGLYAMLANRGRLRPLHYFRDDPADSGAAMLTPESSFLVLDMLKAAQRPNAVGNEGWRKPCGPVAWKTGTSWMFRDAWSVGVFDHYVLAVWVGNFDGKSNAALVGRTAAGPLFFSIVDALRVVEGDDGPLPDWQKTAGLNLSRIDLCSLSGEPAGPNCPHRIQGWFVPGVSPIARCQVHQEILVDARSGLRVSAWSGIHDAKKEVYEVWPSDMLALFEKAGLPRKSPPPFGLDDPGRIAASGQKRPEIVTPQARAEFRLRVNDEKGRTISLKATTAGGAGTVYWFANHSFLGVCAANATLDWRLSPGSFNLTAIDEFGQADSRLVTVSVVE